MEEIAKRPDLVIFPVPYTSNMDMCGRVVLSTLSDMSITASMVVLEDNPEATVVLAGERTFGANAPSTGELMAEKLADFGLRQDRLVLLDDRFSGGLDNTALQVTAFNLWLQQFEGNAPHVLTLAHRFHLPRLDIHMGRYGIRTAYAGIAKILVDSGLQHHFPELAYVDMFEKRERFVRYLAHIDRKGTVTKIITKVLGPHVHDLLIGNDGEAIVIDMSSKSRMEELAAAGLKIG